MMDLYIIKSKFIKGDISAQNVRNSFVTGNKLLTGKSKKDKNFRTYVIRHEKMCEISGFFLVLPVKK